MVRLPDAVHELIEWELEIAYQQGYRAALADVAAGHAELDAVWRRAGRRGYERRVAERTAEMERCAERLRAELAARDSRAGPWRSRSAEPWPPVAVPGGWRGSDRRAA
jgi:hypothetical protein